MMRFLLLLVYITQTELIVHGSDRIILQDESSACEGYVQIYHENQWGYFGDKHWNMSTEKVVCRSTHCGEPVPGSTENVERPQSSTVWLNEVKCTGTESDLWSCMNYGWNVSSYAKDTVKKMKCSNKIKISLDGFQCAGAVQYSTDGNTPSGYICDENWSHKEADFLCEKLNCNKSKEIPVDQWMVWERFEISKNMMIKCLDIKNVEKDLWRCVTEESKCKKPASVICQGHERLQLKGDASNVCSGQLQIENNGKWQHREKVKTSPDAWCHQMYCGTKSSHSINNNSTHVNCSDKVNVVLMDSNNKPSRCYGRVHIEVNGSSHPVCASTWDRKEGELVCKELNCGKLISAEQKSDPIKGIMDYVNCSGSESSLWHCRAKRGKKLLQCSSTAYVVCQDSVDVRLKDGPGKCAGRLEILNEGAWKTVSTKDWTEVNSNTVCKELNCGTKRNTTNGEKFIKGSGDYLARTVTCQENSKKVSECIGAPKQGNIRGEVEAVGITCTGHKMLFLHGNNACSGRVGIEKGSKSYWLSGSNQTWNQAAGDRVCQQMHCGNTANISVIKDADVIERKEIWTEPLCLKESESLFDCLKSQNSTSSDANGTIATVTCPGEIKITLSNKCWGAVNISMGQEYGGVCADTWTNDQSEMLCKNLNCGNKSLSVTNRQNMRVMFKSLHLTKMTTQLSQSNFVKYGENYRTCNHNPANVVCSGSVKPRFSFSRHKCFGNVELFYEGKWLPVCADGLDQKILCKELGCGDAVRVIDYFGHKPATYSAISLKCPENGNGLLRECNISQAKGPPCQRAGLQCSNSRKMKLSDTCRGEVFVAEEKKYPVSSEGWTAIEGQRLCQDLGCGSFVSSSTINKTLQSFWDRSFSCADVESKTIWDCEKEIPPTRKQQLFIECKDVPVTLSSSCNGIVKINGIEVCNTGWNNTYSHLVCQEQDCSNAIPNVKMLHSPVANKEYYHVRCDYGQYKLGQCERVKGKCNGQLVSVSCVGNVKFNTTETCGGTIKVKYQDNWKELCPLTLSPVAKNKLCQNLGCVQSIDISRPVNNAKVSLNTSLECADDSVDIRHCVRVKSCESVKAAEIYCQGYVPPPPPPPETPKPPILAIILGVGLFLVLVIVIVVFARICIIKRAKKSSLRMQSLKDVEFESGDYEDVKANEMEDFSRGRFSSEAEVMMDHDKRSISSFHYDDVDEVLEPQPLTSQASTTDASGDNYLHEDTLDQNLVTYEVDEPQENYDDIEAGPEITKTKADVHNSHETTPESDTVLPPELVQGDDDYLVPDQNG